MLGRGDVGDLLVLEHGLLHRALGIHDVGDGQIAQARLRKHQLAELARVAGDVRRRIVEVLGHVDDVGADHLPVLVQVGVRHVERVEHDRHGLLVEPVVECAREGGGGGNGEQQRRQRRDDAEEGDDAHVQARARNLLLPGAPQPHDVHRDDRHHRDHQQQVDEQDDVDDLLARHDGGQIGQDQEGRQRRYDRQAHDDEADPERPRAGARQRGGVGLQQGVERTLRLGRQAAHALRQLPHCAGHTRAGFLQCGAGSAACSANGVDHLLSAHLNRGSLQQRDHTVGWAVWHFRDIVGLAICRASVKRASSGPCGVLQASREAHAATAFSTATEARANGPLQRPGPPFRHHAMKPRKSLNARLPGLGSGAQLTGALAGLGAAGRGLRARRGHGAGGHRCASLADTCFGRPRVRSSSSSYP